MRATVITDASFCHKTKAAGWACWISADNGKTKKGGKFHKCPRTSQEAEYWAALNGVALALQVGAVDILLQSDCLSVVNKLNRAAASSRVRTDLRKASFSLSRHTLRCRHVKGHQSSSAGARFFVNNWCDKHAKVHMNQQRKEPV